MSLMLDEKTRAVKKAGFCFTLFVVAPMPQDTTSVLVDCFIDYFPRAFCRVYRCGFETCSHLIKTATRFFLKGYANRHHCICCADILFLKICSVGNKLCCGAHKWIGILVLRLHHIPFFFFISHHQIDDLSAVGCSAKVQHMPTAFF